MGYRGKVKEQEEARRLRAQNLTIVQIAQRLGVSKSSVSLWVRDVPFTPSKRRYGARSRAPSRASVAKQAQIAHLNDVGRRRLGVLSEEAFFAAGIALYAGEGAKGDHEVQFANTDSRMIAFFCAWLRRYFEIDESRLRVRVYLHEGLDMSRAEQHWSRVTGVPRSQFRKGYRAVPDPTIRRNKHEHGCCYVRYTCTRTHREIMGLIRALLSSDAIPG